MVENPTLREKNTRFALLEKIASLNLARRMIAQSFRLFIGPAQVGRRPPVILRASARKTDVWFARKCEKMSHEKKRGKISNVVFFK
jgi:hypothetical protein